MSTFITAADYTARVKSLNLSTMLGEDPATSTTLANAEAEAIATVRSYLHQWYAVDTIFQQTGTNRNLHLVGMVINVALKILHERLPQRVTPDWVQRNYDETITFLERVNDGKTTMELPPRPADTSDDPGGETKFRWGSQPARKDYRQIPGGGLF